MNVLIAEDEAIIRLDMKEILTQAGHTVVAEARNGKDAIRLAIANTPDCIFMDAHMEGDDGIEAAQAISDMQICPIVMVTAYSQIEKVKEAAHAGVFGYITKPFTEQDLLTSMEVAQTRFEQARAMNDEIEKLKTKIETRKVVDKAKGILIESGMGEEEAFSYMQKRAMDTRTPLRNIAEAILLVGKINS